MFRALTPTRSINTSLYALVLACVVPLVFLALALLFLLYEDEQVRIQQDKLQTARSLVKGFDSTIESTRTSLATLATSRMLRWGNFPEFHAQMRDVQSAIGAESVLLIAPDGQIALSTLAAYGTQLPKLAKAPLLSRTLQTGQGGVSDLFFGPIAKQLILTVSEPVVIDGKVAFALNVTFSPEQMAKLIQGPEFPDAWRVVLADASGHVVARSHGIAELLGKPVSQDLKTAIEHKDEGILQLRTLEGTSSFAAFSRSKQTRWTVAIAVPLSVANAALQRSVRNLSIVGVSALSLGLVLAHFLASRIAHAIRSLVSAADAIGRGEKPDFAHTPIREVMAVQAALKQAANALSLATHDAMHDSLTGLGNRALLNLLLQQNMHRCSRDRTELSVLFLDLDGFKAINDNYGHPAGDALLIAVATRLTSQVRTSDVVVRLGGDEFVVVLVGATSNIAQSFATTLIETLSQPYTIDSHDMRISASIGIATFCGEREDQEDCQQLLLRADTALYKAKESGKHRACIAPDPTV